MLESIHQSSLGMALRCGEQFRRRYVEGEVHPPGVAAIRGTALHYANEVNMKQKVNSQEDLPESDLQDAARDKYVERVSIEGVHLVKEDLSRKNDILNDGLNQTVALTSLYRKEVAPEIQPVEVERPFELRLDGCELPIGGRMDIESSKRVHDLKGAGKAWAKGQIEKEIQPVFYSLGHEIIEGVRPEFVYHILVATKDPYRQIQSITVTERHYEALKAKIQTVERMLKAGVFPPANPTSWWCSPKWCGYYLTCKYVGN